MACEQSPTGYDVKELPAPAWRHLVSSLQRRLPARDVGRRPLATRGDVLCIRSSSHRGSFGKGQGSAPWPAESVRPLARYDTFLTW